MAGHRPWAVDSARAETDSIQLLEWDIPSAAVSNSSLYPPAPGVVLGHNGLSVNIYWVNEVLLASALQLVIWWTLWRSVDYFMSLHYFIDLTHCPRPKIGDTMPVTLAILWGQRKRRRFLLSANSIKLFHGGFLRSSQKAHWITLAEATTCWALC